MRLPAVDIQFDSVDEEQAYAGKDYALAQLIEQAVINAANGLPPDQSVHTHYDWWPNQNRAVTVSKRAFNKASLLALAGLLIGEYQDWRINVRVVDELPDEDSELGNLFIAGQKVVIQQSLCALLENAA